MRLTAALPRAAELGVAAALTVLAALALASPAAALEQKLYALDDGAAYDNLGSSVAVDGDTIVLGAPAHDVGGRANQGAVYVYQRSADGWPQTATAKLTVSDGTANDRLGTSVAIDGDTIVAGAEGDGANAYQGSVYTFARTGAAARTETAKLTASDGALTDLLGGSVAIDGDTIAAGASGDDVGANADQGSVYTFARTGAAARTETAKLTASDGARSDQLGYSVAIDGETIVAGAYKDDVGANPTNHGSVYTFARTGAARTETAKLTASDGAAGDELGRSVAIDGDTIAAGTVNDDVGKGAGQGSVYTFASTGATARTETAKLTASDGAASDQLGISVAIDGETIVAGAYLDDVAYANQGSAYTFARTGAAARTETAKLTSSFGAANDQLGYSVAVDGGTIVAGAPFDDVGGTSAAVDRGTASVFFSVADADSDGVPDSSDSCPTGASSGADADGDGCKNAGEDSDDDNDTVGDASDSCPTGASSGADTDGDGCKNAGEDSDDDNDTVADASDGCPTVARSGADTDGDGCTDEGADTTPPGTTPAPDADRDGVTDATDNCPAVANAGQQNTYGDARGDACEPDTFKPTLSALSLPDKFRAGKQTTIKLTLDEAAKVRFTVKRRNGGRRVGGKCKPRTRANIDNRKCHLQLKGAFTRTAKPGKNKFTWNGKLRGKRLPVGQYLLIATPRDAAGNKGKPKKTAFQIVR